MNAEPERRLAGALRTLRRAGGECPSPDAIDRYLSGESSDWESRQIRDHIAGCGVCDWVIEKAKDFDGAEKLPERTGVAWFRRPILAYSLAALLAYPAYLGISGRGARTDRTPPPAAATAGLQPALLLDVNPVRAGAGSVPRLPREPDSVVLLTVVLPARDGAPYDLAVLDAAGRVVADRSGLGSESGEFFVALPRRLLRAGAYTLRVEGDRQRFQFPFTLSE